MVINKQYSWLIVIGLLIVLTGCKKTGGESVVISQDASLPPNANAKDTVKKDAPETAKPATAGTDEPSRVGRLQGTYAISEVQHDGIVEMISAGNSTEITFVQPGSFSRQSKVNGTINHTDSGQYRIEGNELVLKIVLSKNQIQAKPVEKRFAFVLSTDGDELKLTTSKNRTAVFRKIK